MPSSQAIGPYTPYVKTGNMSPEEAFENVTGWSPKFIDLSGIPGAEDTAAARDLRPPTSVGNVLKDLKALKKSPLVTETIAPAVKEYFHRDFADNEIVPPWPTDQEMAEINSRHRALPPAEDFHDMRVLRGLMTRHPAKEGAVR